MTGKGYISELAKIEIDKEKVNQVATAYTKELPEIIWKIVSDKETPVFLDDDSRVMSLEEILDAEKDLHVAFRDKGMIPLVDCCDNDFIVYHFRDQVWSKFNIVDETVFKKKANIEDLLN